VPTPGLEPGPTVGLQSLVLRPMDLQVPAHCHPARQVCDRRFGRPVPANWMTNGSTV